MPPLLKAVFIAAAFGPVLALAPPPAFAVCAAQPEEGWWMNIEKDTQTVTRVRVRFVCNDFKPSDYFVTVYWRSSPKDWVSGEIHAHRLDSEPSVVGTKKRFGIGRIEIQTRFSIHLPYLLLHVRRYYYHPWKSYIASVALEKMSSTDAGPPCPVNTYQQEGQCLACPHDGKSNTGTLTSTDCYCPENTYIGESDRCVACPAGTHSEAMSVLAIETHLKDAHCKPF